jgi:hypothetical protein
MKNKIKIIPNELRSRLVKIGWRWIDLAKAMGAGIRTIHNWNKNGWPVEELDIALTIVEKREQEKS